MITLFRILIVIALTVILYSPKSRIIEEDIKSSIGKKIFKVFWASIWCYLILNFWQVIGFDYTPFLKALKYGSIATILMTVILFFSKQDLSNDNVNERLNKNH